MFGQIVFTLVNQTFKKPFFLIDNQTEGSHLETEISHVLNNN